MIREGPGGSVAVQRPSGPVVTAAAWVNAFEPLSGAVRIATGWPASGRPALLISSPCTLTGWPNATSARVASLAVDVPQLLCRFTVPALGCPRDARLPVGVRQRQSRRSRRSRRRGPLRRRVAPGQPAREAEGVRHQARAQTRLPGRLEPRSPAGDWLRVGRLGGRSLAGARAGASRGGDLLEAHLGDGLRPRRQRQRPGG